MVRVEESVDVPTEAEPVTVQLDYFHAILLGGDQMTCARVRGGQRIRENSESGKARLEGLVPAIEDWHAKVCFMQVRSNNYNFGCDLFIYCDEVLYTIPGHMDKVVWQEL